MRRSNSAAMPGVQSVACVSISMESSKSAPPFSRSSARMREVRMCSSQWSITARVPAALKWSTT